MTSSNNRIRIYIRTSQLTDDVQARIFEMGGNFTQRDAIGEGDHAVTVWELAHYDTDAWQEVEKWMVKAGVDLNTEILLPVGKKKKSR